MAQFTVTWALLVLESLREGNKGRFVSWWAIFSPRDFSIYNLAQTRIAPIALLLRRGLQPNLLESPLPNLAYLPGLPRLLCLLDPPRRRLRSVHYPPSCSRRPRGQLRYDDHPEQHRLAPELLSRHPNLVIVLALSADLSVPNKLLLPLRLERCVCRGVPRLPRQPEARVANLGAVHLSLCLDSVYARLYLVSGVGL
jgi:hypothetical protein